jgi:hypothetical protein
MEEIKSDYARGLDAGLQMALDVINSTAGVKFESVAEVGMYLFWPERYAHFKKPAKEKEPS